MGFAAVGGAFTVNMLIKPLGAVLVEFTNDAIQLVEPTPSLGSGCPVVVAEQPAQPLAATNVAAVARWVPGGINSLPSPCWLRSPW
jgi:p-aminobenzoyl-glutamate transporter AbgT